MLSIYAVFGGCFAVFLIVYVLHTRGKNGS